MVPDKAAGGIQKRHQRRQRLPLRCLCFSLAPAGRCIWLGLSCKCYGLKHWLKSSAPVMGLLLFWTSTKALIKIFLTASVLFIRKDTRALGIPAQP